MGLLVPWEAGVVPSRTGRAKVLNLTEIRQYGAGGTIHPVKSIAGVWLPMGLQELPQRRSKNCFIVLQFVQVIFFNTMAVIFKLNVFVWFKIEFEIQTFREKLFNTTGFTQLKKHGWLFHTSSPLFFLHRQDRPDQLACHISQWIL